ncbi:MAG: hypothetical protein ACM3VS_17915 [Candidatus Dadabacteria bacterium]
MKRLPLLLTLAMLLVLSSYAQNPAAKPTAMKQNDLPYKAHISSDVQMGDQQYLRMVENAWKAWDNNKLDAMAMILSDTLTAIMADGTMIKGKDKFISAGKEYRGSLASATSEVHVATPLKFIDHGNMPVVSIWGIETDVKKDGSKDVYAVNEVWAFNKDGQVFFFRQFMSKEPKQ